MGIIVPSAHAILAIASYLVGGEYQQEDGEYVINPSRETELLPKSKLFVLGTPEQIHKLNSVFGIAHTR